MDEHEHFMYVTGTEVRDGVTYITRQCFYCDHSDEVKVGA